MRRAHDDRGVSSVVGGIMVLGVLSLALLYVNGLEVPRQGAALEEAARDDAQRSLAALVARMDGSSTVTGDLPLAPPAADPPLLGGLVLSPARASGVAVLDPEGARLTLSVVLPLAGGAQVPADDPTRAAEPGGLQRVYLLGNATQGRSLGALTLETGGAYLAPARLRLEGGALLQPREGAGDALVAPALRATRAADAHAEVRWTVPVLEGAAAETGGRGAALVSLAPGAPALAAGEGAREVRVRVETQHADAWEAALRQALGSMGSVTRSGDVVEAVVAAPEGGAGIRFALGVVAYEAALVGQTS